MPVKKRPSEFRPSSDARFCSAKSIDVKVRVITVLLSSAAGSVIVNEAIFSSAWPSAHEIASVGIERVLKNSAALRTSEVCPEREMRTAAYFPELGKTKSEDNKASEAGSARAGSPPQDVIVAAAQGAT